MRSGCVPAQTSRCHRFQARVQASPSSGSSAREKTAPQNPATNEGKHSEAQIPAMSMSATRASMSKHPGRISSNRAGSMLHSARGRPTTALSPTLGYERPSNRHDCAPSGSSWTAGARSASRRGIRPSKQSGGSIRWSSTEMTGATIGRGSGSGSRVLATAAEASVGCTPMPGLDLGEVRDGPTDGRPDGTAGHRPVDGGRGGRHLPGGQPGSSRRGGPGRTGRLLGPAGRRRGRRPLGPATVGRPRVRRPTGRPPGGLRSGPGVDRPRGHLDPPDPGARKDPGGVALRPGHHGRHGGGAWPRWWPSPSSPSGSATPSSNGSPTGWWPPSCPSTGRPR